jgi:hypothetical protein
MGGLVHGLQSAPLTDGTAPARRLDGLMAVAVTTTIVHLLALALAAVSIAPGTMAADPAARATYLAARPLGWTAGWAMWMASALTLVAFLALLAERVPSAGTRLAVALASAAAAVDLSADTLQITLRPALAAGGPTVMFLAVETALDGVGFVAANGLYSCAVLAATLGAARATGPIGRALGGATFAAGIALAAAGFPLHAKALQITAAATMLFFVAWALFTARVLREHPR